MRESVIMTAYRHRGEAEHLYEKKKAEIVWLQQPHKDAQF